MTLGLASQAPSPAALPPITEHDPLWHDAVVKVTANDKGAPKRRSSCGIRTATT